MSGAQIEGLRARKKRVAREAIAATARRLFAERGFEHVTVAEIAAAADVTEKTVFNHFPTKVDLAFAGREEGITRLVADITERPPGTSVLDVFRALTTDRDRPLRRPRGRGPPRGGQDHPRTAPRCRSA